MKSYLCISILLLFTAACNNIDNGFIEKYGNEDFSLFAGYRITSIKPEGFGRLPIVFFIEELNDTSQIRYVVELNDDRNEIKNMRKVFIRSRNATDGVIKERKRFREMILKYNEFNIFMMRVDSRNNVFITQRFDRQDKIIAKIEDFESVDRSKWTQIKDNWYKTNKR
jgi:hypothetical protein